MVMTYCITCGTIAALAGPLLACVTCTAGLDNPILDPAYPLALLDADLREMGVDPDALARRGLEFVAGLLKERRGR